MSSPEPTRPPFRVPVLVWPGLLFLVIGVVTDDVWAYAAGGALLVLASLQWGRS